MFALSLRNHLDEESVQWLSVKPSAPGMGWRGCGSRQTYSEVNSLKVDRI